MRLGGYEFFAQRLRSFSETRGMAASCLAPCPLNRVSMSIHSGTFGPMNSVGLESLTSMKAGTGFLPKLKLDLSTFAKSRGNLLCSSKFMRLPFSDATAR